MPKILIAQCIYIQLSDIIIKIKFIQTKHIVQIFVQYEENCAKKIATNQVVTTFST